MKGMQAFNCLYLHIFFYYNAKFIKITNGELYIHAFLKEGFKISKCQYAIHVRLIYVLIEAKVKPTRRLEHFV